MSVHSLRIHARAEAMSDRMSVIVDMWSPIHRDGLGTAIVTSIEDVATQIRSAYDARLTDEKLQRLSVAEAQVQEAKHGIHRAVNRALLDETEGVLLTRTLTGLSISIIEFANAVLERDPEYRGSWRGWVERRRAWRARLAEQQDVELEVGVHEGPIGAEDEDRTESSTVTTEVN